MRHGGMVVTADRAFCQEHGSLWAEGDVGNWIGISFPGQRRESDFLPRRAGKPTACVQRHRPDLVALRRIGPPRVLPPDGIVKPATVRPDSPNAAAQRGMGLECYVRNGSRRRCGSREIATMVPCAQDSAVEIQTVNEAIIDVRDVEVPVDAIVSNVPQSSVSGIRQCLKRGDEPRHTVDLVDFASRGARWEKIGEGVGSGRGHIHVAKGIQCEAEDVTQSRLGPLRSCGSVIHRGCKVRIYRGRSLICEIGQAKYNVGGIRRIARCDCHGACKCSRIYGIGKRGFASAARLRGNHFARRTGDFDVADLGLVGLACVAIEIDQDAAGNAPPRGGQPLQTIDQVRIVKVQRVACDPYPPACAKIIIDSAR